MQPSRVRSLQAPRWVSVVALIIGLSGAALVTVTLTGARQGPLTWAVAAVLATAALELLVASALGAAGLSHRAAGGIALGFGLFLFALSRTTDQAFAPAPVTLLLGVFCVANGLLRALDVGFLRPPSWPLEGLNALVTLVLGGVALSTWPSATASTVSVIAGVELFSAALAIVGSAGTFTGPALPVRRRRPMHLAPRGTERPA
jgi:hypothetical protein